MKDLIKAGLILSDAITTNAKVWICEIESVSDTIEIDFSLNVNKHDIAALFLKQYTSSKKGNNTLIFKLNSLREWVKVNKDKVIINGSKVRFKTKDVNGWDFLLKRLLSVNDDEWDDSGMPSIEKNDFVVKSMFVDGVYKDYFYSAETDSYYDLEWNGEFKGRRKWLQAKEPYSYYKINL